MLCVRMVIIDIVALNFFKYGVGIKNNGYDDVE